MEPVFELWSETRTAFLFQGRLLIAELNADFSPKPVLQRRPFPASGKGRRKGGSHRKNRRPRKRFKNGVLFDGLRGLSPRCHVCILPGLGPRNGERAPTASLRGLFFYLYFFTYFFVYSVF